MKRLKLSLEVVQVYHMDGDRERTYFGPYEVESDGIIVGEGKLVCYSTIKLILQKSYTDSLIFTVTLICKTNR